MTVFSSLSVQINACVECSYWTDNGACYYYNDGGYANYEELLVAVKEDADKQEIPYRYLQVPTNEHGVA